MRKNSWRGGETASGIATPEDLALAVHRRCDGAFEALVESFDKPLFNYVQRLLQNVEDAQEVVQDAFVRAHRALTRQYSEGKCRSLLLRPWLFRIARNLCHNKRRGKRRQLERPLADNRLPTAIERPDSQVSILCRVEQKEELERLDRSLARLPVEAREVLVLRFIEEMSYAEIARTTGAGEASLRGKVFRGLRQLREVLQDEEVAHAL